MLNGFREDRRKTVVIVGGTVSGLAALWELSHHNDLFRIILVDQREYFEFTPGILQLFCEPEYFPNVAKNYQMIPQPIKSYKARLRVSLRMVLMARRKRF
jgi:NADH dehydrogenase FAD-containing subunit